MSIPRAPLFALALAACGVASGDPAKPAKLPDPAPAAPAADLAKDHACGAFSSKNFASADVPLLDDRMRVKFLPDPKVEGGTDSVRAAVESKGTSAFVGARELFMKGDADFARFATRQASFNGTYDPVTIPGRDGKVSIVTGLLKSAPGNSDVVAVAHGWFLDGDGNVLDIAVFASDVTSSNLAECRLFAEKVIATASVGKRALVEGSGKAVDTVVSYATFKYALPAGWFLAGSEGIHDFARITFRHRGTYPDGFTEVQLGLDSYPGDWKTPGSDDGTRKGKLLGLDVTWQLTKDTDLAGAWAISKGTSGRDHAVGAVFAGTAADRDAAIKFAESITTK
jgi:hypothetical protein